MPSVCLFADAVATDESILFLFLPSPSPAFLEMFNPIRINFNIFILIFKRISSCSRCLRARNIRQYYCYARHFPSFIRGLTANSSIFNQNYHKISSIMQELLPTPNSEVKLNQRAISPVHLPSLHRVSYPGQMISTSRQDRALAGTGRGLRWCLA